MAKNISEELDWLESKANSIKQYVDANPYHLVQDRTVTKYTKDGGAYEDVVQKIEVIQKSLRDSLKEYADLIAQIDKLREEEKKKEVEARGNTKMNSRMKNLTSK